MATGIQLLMRSFGIDISPEKIQAGIAEAQQLVSGIASSLARIEAQNLLIMQKLGIHSQQTGGPNVETGQDCGHGNGTAANGAVTGKSRDGGRVEAP